MTLLETVDARCRQIGIDDTVDDATLPTATLLSGGSDRSTVRELPRISVNVRGSLGGAAASSPAPGVRDLEVLETLGEGGMGRVFLARQHSLDREVAIKTLRDGASDRDRKALIHEGAITGHLEHPSIVPVHALGLDEHARPVLVMKRVVGRPWSELLEQRPGDLDEHLGVLMQVCNAVEFAHSRGILHRDIKPQNVLVGEFGEVQLCDFGVAVRLAELGEDPPLSGTPAYMAPEMVVGGELDARSDVYLLGATLHQVLTGQSRHAGASVRETLLAAAKSRPVEYPPTVPPPLAALANASTALDRADRPPSASAFRERVSGYLRHKSSVALASSAKERLATLRAQASSSDEQAQHALDVLGAEARLALNHALSDWPENPEALEGLAELEALLSARRARAAELERLAHDFDPAISHRQRVAITGALMVLGLLLAVLGLQRTEITTRGLFLESLLPDVLVITMVVALRRPMMRTAFNRNMALGLVGWVLALTLSRGVSLLAEVPASAAIRQDLVLVAGMAAGTTVLLERRFVLISVLFLACAVWVARVPAHAGQAFSVASGLSLALATAIIARRNSLGSG